MQKHNLSGYSNLYQNTMMKNTLFKLFCAAFVLTTVSYLMDGDPTEPKMAVRFAEFAAVLAIFYLIISVLWFSAGFLFRKLRRS